MRGQKGYTLSELVVSLGVMSIVILIASALSSWAIFRYFSVRDRLLADAVAYKGEGFFRNFYGQAVDVGFTTGSVPGTLAGRSGVIHHTGAVSILPSGVRSASFNFSTMSASAVWTPISLFYRESAAVPGPAGGYPSGYTSGLASDLRRTAVFYRRPTQTTSGVIFFNVSSPSSSTGTLAPNYAEPFIERVSSFSMSKIGALHYDKTTSIEVSFSIRYHLFSGRGTTWCPQLDIQSGTCGSNSNWRDIQRKFTVTIANNLLKPMGTLSQHSAVASEERTMGGLYLFRILSPARNQ